MQDRFIHISQFTIFHMNFFVVRTGYHALLMSAALSLCAIPTRVIAGAQSDELSKCLVSSVTADDRAHLVKWMFSNTSAHPETKNFTAISAKQVENINRAAASVIERLITGQCQPQYEVAIKAEGSTGIQLSFSALGQMAMRDLLLEANVRQAFLATFNHIDEEAFLKAARGHAK